MLLDYKTTKMRFQKTFLLCHITICAKNGWSDFLLEVIISCIEDPSQWFLLKYLLKGSKLGWCSYFVIWLTLWHNGTQVMSWNLAWTTLNCFLVCLPINKIIRSFILKEKQVLVWAYCSLACAALVENLRLVAVMKR